MTSQVSLHEELADMCMRHVVALAELLCNDAWHRAGVCKYMRKLLRDMTQFELEAMTEAELEDLSQHAAEGFDRWRRRRLL